VKHVCYGIENETKNHSAYSTVQRNIGIWPVYKRIYSKENLDDDCCGGFDKFYTKVYADQARLYIQLYTYTRQWYFCMDKTITTRHWDEGENLYFFCKVAKSFATDDITKNYDGYLLMENYWLACFLQR